MHKKGKLLANKRQKKKAMVEWQCSARDAGNNSTVATVYAGACAG